MRKMGRLQGLNVKAITMSDLRTSASVEWKDLFIYLFNLSKDINNAIIP